MSHLSWIFGSRVTSLQSRAMVQGLFCGIQGVSFEVNGQLSTRGRGIGDFLALKALVRYQSQENAGLSKEMRGMDQF